MEKIEKLNPKVKEIEIGIRNFRKIKVYPLSAYDQLKLASFFSDAVAKFLEIAETSNLQIIEFVRNVLETNIEEILKMVTDYDEDMLKEIDNEQLLSIVDVVYETNFASVMEKNESKVMTLIKNRLSSTKLSPILSEPIPNTESSMFTETALEKGD